MLVHGIMLSLWPTQFTSWWCFCQEKHNTTTAVHISLYIWVDNIFSECSILVPIMYRISQHIQCYCFVSSGDCRGLIEMELTLMIGKFRVITNSLQLYQRINEWLAFKICQHSSSSLVSFSSLEDAFVDHFSNSSTIKTGHKFQDNMPLCQEDWKE